jgi:hypothetical protein
VAGSHDQTTAGNGLVIGVRRKDEDFAHQRFFLQLLVGF